MGPTPHISMDPITVRTRRNEASGNEQASSVLLYAHHAQRWRNGIHPDGLSDWRKGKCRSISRSCTESIRGRRCLTREKRKETSEKREQRKEKSTGRTPYSQYGTCSKIELGQQAYGGSPGWLDKDEDSMRGIFTVISRGSATFPASCPLLSQPKGREREG